MTRMELERRRSGLSQTELARAVNVSQTAISKLERRAHKKLSAQVRKAVEEYFNESLEDLLAAA